MIIHSEGSQILGAKAHQVLCDVDSAVEEMAIRKFDAIPITIPSTLPSALTKAIQYEEMFGDNLMRAVPVQVATTKEMFLSPAACLPVYPFVPELLERGKWAMTSRVRVFRNEDLARLSAVRLREFNVREIIVIGDPQRVRDALIGASRWAQEFLKSLGVVTRLVDAQDHFSGPTRASSLLAKLQIASQTKQELVIDTEFGGLALASFNNHAYHFSSPFGWDENRSVVSGCIGFGLERCVYALASRCNPYDPTQHVGAE